MTNNTNIKKWITTMQCTRYDYYCSNKRIRYGLCSI